MKNQSKSRKQKIFISIDITVVAIIIYRIYLNSPYTHVEERKIINYALQGSKSDFKVNRIYLNRDKKTIAFLLLKKYRGDEKQFTDIRTRMNEYLEKNPDYFLNDDYRIVIEWIGNHCGGPGIIRFTNFYPTNYLNEKSKIKKKFNYIDCLEILYENSFKFTLNDITDFSKYEDIKGLVLGDNVRINDIKILGNFKSLEFFKPNNEITDEDLENFKSMFSDCEIYGR